MIPIPPQNTTVEVFIAIDTIKHVCLALDELVAEQMGRFQAEIAERVAETLRIP